MKRHSWCRVKVHVYVCTKCGCGRVNEEGAPGCFMTRYHSPDGTSKLLYAPKCEPGARTAAALAKYESAIAVGGLPKERRDEA